MKLMSKPKKDDLYNSKMFGKRTPAGFEESDNTPKHKT